MAINIGENSNVVKLSYLYQQIVNIQMWSNLNFALFHCAMPWIPLPPRKTTFRSTDL